VVRGVGLRRRGAPERARSWAGPPPLLLLATLVGLLVAPFVDDDASPQAVAEVSAHSSPSSAPATAPGATPTPATDPTPADPPGPGDPRLERPRVPPTRGGAAFRGVAPLQLRPVTVGVATANMFRKLSTSEARADADRLVSDDRIDVIGWQEADSFPGVLHSLPGFASQTFPWGKGSSEVAVSWRRSEFTLASAHRTKVAVGVGSTEGRYPFGNRLVAVVTLRHRETGRLLTVVDTHLPQKIEDLSWPGHWAETLNAGRARHQLTAIRKLWAAARGRWVVGTGDYNFDARADARVRLPNAPREALAGTARSSFQVLGLPSTPTHQPGDRYIDYVWADEQGLRDGEIRFLGQRVVRGLNSDHNAVVARLSLG
jgi:hypothetical protein